MTITQIELLGLGALILIYLKSILGNVLQSVGQFVFGIFFEKWVPDSDECRMLLLYLLNHAKRIHVGPHRTGANFAVNCDVDLKDRVYNKISEESALFLLWTPIFYDAEIMDIENILKVAQKNDITVPLKSFYFLRWTINVRKLQLKVREWVHGDLAEFSASMAPALLLTKYVGDKHFYESLANGNNFELKQQPELRKMSSFRLNPSQFDSFSDWWVDHPNKNEKYVLNDVTKTIYNEVKFWKENRDWFYQRGIPYKRGYLLSGPPGSGKTSLVKKLARDLGFSVGIYELNSTSPEDFLKNWNNDVSQIKVIEDIDTVFNGREPIGPNKDNMTFDTLLNVLDGIQGRENIVFITTNRIDHVDAALKRPGRCKVVELKGLEEDGKHELVRGILFDRPDLVEQVLKDGVRDTPAEIQERAMQAALRQVFGE